MDKYDTRTFQSKNIKLDSACSLFSDEHLIPSDLAVLFEDLRFALDRRDPGCDVITGAAGCGGCVNEDADYVVFYIAQDAGFTDGLMLHYDTRSDLPDRSPTLTRTQLGEAIVETAEANGIDHSWPGTPSKGICVGGLDVYD